MTNTKSKIISKTKAKVTKIKVVLNEADEGSEGGEGEALVICNVPGQWLEVKSECVLMVDDVDDCVEVELFDEVFDAGKW